MKCIMHLKCVPAIVQVPYILVQSMLFTCISYFLISAPILSPGSCISSPTNPVLHSVGKADGI